ncbi:unnamed protein product [Prunus armeniaca]
MMRIGHDVLLQGAQLLDTVYSLASHSYHGKARSKSLSQGHLQKLSIALWQPPLVNSLGCDISYGTYKWNTTNQPPYSVTTKQHSTLQPTQCIMNGPSTLNWIVIPFVREFKMGKSR